MADRRRRAPSEKRGEDEPRVISLRNTNIAPPIRAAVALKVVRDRKAPESRNDRPPDPPE